MWFVEVNGRSINREHLPILRGHRADIYHSEVTLPRGMTTTVAKRAWSFQGIAAAFTAIQRNVLLTPRYPASARKKERKIVDQHKLSNTIRDQDITRNSARFNNSHRETQRLKNQNSFKQFCEHFAAILRLLDSRH